MARFDLADDPVLSLPLFEAQARGMSAYLVGGAVRNARLGVPVKDLDLVVDTAQPQSVLALARAVAKRLGGTFVLLDEDRGIARIVLKGGRDLDLATRVGADLDEDLRRRDFTVNAMAWNPLLGELRDPTGGAGDLAGEILRPCGPASLVDDPLRLLRAVRMLCSYPLRPAPGLLDQMRAHAPLLVQVSAERIRDELFACFQAGLWPRWQVLLETGLLFAVLPELQAAARTGQDHYHHLDVLAHTAEALRLLEDFQASGFVDLTAHGALLEKHLARPLVARRTAGDLLKLAVLLHDVGKPGTRTIDASGRTSFPGHAQRGAALAEGIGRRLVLSNREIRRLVRLVAMHLQPLMLAGRDASATERHRLFRAAGDAAPDLLVLSAADARATRGPAQTDDRLEMHRHFVRQMLDEFFQEGRVARPKVPVTGSDLASVFGLPQGPLVGRLLEHIAEAVAEGGVRSREEAMARAAEWLSTES